MAAAVITAASLMPYKFKATLWFSRHTQLLDFVPYPPLAAVLGPAVVINPHIITHAAVYAAAMALMLLLIRSLPRRAGALLLLIVIAALTEFLQRKVYGNPFEWEDLAADTIAATAVFFVPLASAWISSWRRVAVPQDSPK